MMMKVYIVFECESTGDKIINKYTLNDIIYGVGDNEEQVKDIISDMAEQGYIPTKSFV